MAEKSHSTKGLKEAVASRGYLKDREIRRREPRIENPPPTTTMTSPATPLSKINLPPIELPTFSDTYTARAYQLDRDMEKEPTLNDFLSFLDQRALALENAEPGNAQYRSPNAKVVTHVTKEEQACVYYPAADGVTQQQSSDAA
ncbi:uncharacterized protein LOC126380664 isoform X1 [Pectinophora gossypiella]|uniref:uncharacterized protein LOC126372575 n=1 Tax=Pectinophora gossypiella TaxID=13191 RepID=UPI00214E7370|nr:uncharacterized protein LOC126369726 isoform X1 [Pectinophora gossypiella]XP_049874360.1 uncharacterized protein LOC126372575 [Pectinophora gossypiella]XP_049886188.1 uncharacterized protein LOC126380664 isoform X1 [Pectinophora gossypiella]